MVTVTQQKRKRSMLEGAGFSLIELMAVILITVIGFLAMLHLQAGVIRGNTTTWDMVEATNLARHVLETIRMEALEWTNNTTQPVNQSKFTYLKHVSDGGAPAAGVGSGWLKAFDVPNASFQMVNQLGRDGTYDSGALVEFPDTRNRRFCVHYRLTWIIPNELIRAEVRVMWTRAIGQSIQYNDCHLGMENDVTNVYQVTYPSTIMRNSFVTQ